MPEAAPDGFSPAGALLSSFPTNDRINHSMVENLPSQTALRAVLKSALASPGRVKGFRPDAAGFFGYGIAHGPHRRGQISMLARQPGHTCRKRRCPACRSGLGEGNG